MSWEYGNSSCNSELYTGSVCRTFLDTWQDCIPGTAESDIPVITTLDDQAAAEQQALEVRAIIGEFCHTLHVLYYTNYTKVQACIHKGCL